MKRTDPYVEEQHTRDWLARLMQHYEGDVAAVIRRMADIRQIPPMDCLHLLARYYPKEVSAATGLPFDRKKR